MRHPIALRPLACWLLMLCACTPQPDPVGLTNVARRSGDEIVVCGQFYHTGAPVVLWTDPGGFNAYQPHCHYRPEAVLPSQPAGTARVNRFDAMRRNVPAELQEQIRQRGWHPAELARVVDLFVIHYDACGTSGRCFEVLHDVRGLSVHFMIDLDGTIYQTLDVKERAWHAGPMNDRSVGVELANIGAYPDRKPLEPWYQVDRKGHTHIVYPPNLKPAQYPRRRFAASPARNAPVVGSIHGKRLIQYDLTAAQYESLARLSAALRRALPRIHLDAPRDAQDRVRSDELSPTELQAYSGLVGHYHISASKFDPGPAFDWDRLIRRARSLAPARSFD